MNDCTNVAHEEELERMREALRAAEKRELKALAELDEAKAEIARVSDEAMRLHERLNLSKPAVDG